jgi:hypothetical protein
MLIVSGRELPAPIAVSRNDDLLTSPKLETPPLPTLAPADLDVVCPWLELGGNLASRACGAQSAAAAYHPQTIPGR